MSDDRAELLETLLAERYGGVVRDGADNATDRATGSYWEQRFCDMAGVLGKAFTSHQLHREGAAMYDAGRGWTLPDVTIWSAPGEHHEIKHKRATRGGEYGLERYRLNALIRFADETRQAVFYTIHDWELAGATDSQERVPNDLAHWYFGDVSELARTIVDHRRSPTYYNGELRMMDTCYWTASRRFYPLAGLWGVGDNAGDNPREGWG